MDFNIRCPKSGFTWTPDIYLLWYQMAMWLVGPSEYETKWSSIQILTKLTDWYSSRGPGHTFPPFEYQTSRNPHCTNQQTIDMLYAMTINFDKNAI